MPSRPSSLPGPLVVVPAVLLLVLSLLFRLVVMASLAALHPSVALELGFYFNISFNWPRFK